MPIDTDTPAWKDAEAAKPLEIRVEDFLSSNPNRAYRLRELADEILDLDWEAVEQKLRDEEELTDAEFLGEYPPGEAYPTILSHMRPTDKLWVAVTRLVQDGQVEARDIPTQAIETPDPELSELEAVTHYSYKSE